MVLLTQSSVPSGINCDVWNVPVSGKSAASHAQSANGSVVKVK
jgi:hypothetical protein